ncbi:hypothetical protein BOVA208_4067 [Bacteroides ovatus]|nr:hypothetical protein BOVA208_4067 [Bacteroides ovatus]
MKIELETLISECIVYDFKLILEKMKFNTCRSNGSVGLYGKAIGEKIKNKCKEDEL